MKISGKKEITVRHKNIIIFLLAILVFILFLSPVTIQAALSKPQLLQPPNNATGINPKNVNFAWQFSGNETVEYIFELDTTNSFSSETKIRDYVTDNKYTLNDNLGTNTKYYWRVAAYSDSETSEWSDIFSFTTSDSSAGSPPSGTTPPGTTQTPGAGDNVSGTKPSGNIIESINSFIKEVGWPIFASIIFIFVIVVVLILALVARPKKKSPQYSSQPYGFYSGVQNLIRCSTCGFMNAQGKTFCSNCGSALVTPTQFTYATASQRSTQIQGLKCSACGAMNPPGSVFCGNCGAKLGVAEQTSATAQGSLKMFCPNCGTQSDQGKQFCSNCGTKLILKSDAERVIGTVQTYTCPICGYTLNRNQNPCPGCNTWLDWS